MDVVATHVLQDPRVHGGVASVLSVVHHGYDVVSQPGCAEDLGHPFRGEQTGLLVLELFQRDAHSAAQMPHEITHGRPGIYKQIPRPANMFFNPIGGNEGGHQPIASKSVETLVGLTTDCVTGEPSTASRQISRRVASSASARTKHLAEMLP